MLCMEDTLQLGGPHGREQGLDCESGPCSLITAFLGKIVLTLGAQKQVLALSLSSRSTLSS